MHGHRHAFFEGRAGRCYDFLARRPLRGLYRRIADDLVDTVADGARVLDVGTGPGVLLVELAQRRADLRLTGVDLSADMVSAAEANLRPFGDRAVARVADVTELPFADHAFDVIVTSYSLHHWDDPAGAVPELARVLRPGGRLYVYDFGHAPFDVLTDAARARGVFPGPVRRTQIRTGVPFFNRCVRQIMTG